MLRYMLVILFALIWFVSYNLGMDSINFNTGIHPLITFPIAILSTVCGTLTWFWDDVVTTEYICEV